MSKMYKYQLKYQVPSLKLSLVRLIDTTQGFNPSNRNIISSFNYGPITQSEVQRYSNNQQELEPLVPLCLYSGSYFDCQVEEPDTIQLLLTSDNRQPKQLFRVPIGATLDQLIEAVQQEYNLDKFQRDDPDNKYFPFCNSVYVFWQKRRQLEAECPYLYVQISLSQCCGCEHRECGCYIWCEICKQSFGCFTCHNEEVDDHQMKEDDVQKVTCCACDQIQQFGNTVCENCGFQFASYICLKCKTMGLNCEEFNPMYHCDLCETCHTGLKQQFSVHCDKCKNCYSTLRFENHPCKRDKDDICCVCQGPITSMHFVTKMKCNHLMHSECYDKYLSNDNNIQLQCPMCKKSMLQEENFLVSQYEMVSQFIIEPDLEWEYDGSVVISNFQCNECNGSVFQDFNFRPCIYCNSPNIVPIIDESLEEITIPSDDFLALWEVMTASPDLIDAMPDIKLRCLMKRIIDQPNLYRGIIRELELGPPDEEEEEGEEEDENEGENIVEQTNQVLDQADIDVVKNVMNAIASGNLNFDIASIERFMEQHQQKQQYFDQASMQQHQYQQQEKDFNPQFQFSFGQPFRNNEQQENKTQFTFNFDNVPNQNSQSTDQQQAEQGQNNTSKPVQRDCDEEHQEEDSK